MKIVSIIIVVVVLSGCALEKPVKARSKPPVKPAMRALGQPADPSDVPSDEAIGFAIRRRFDLMDAPSLVSVVIEVNDRAVTLRGFAPDRTTAWRAEAAARAVAGVKEVQNQILIRSP